MDSRKGFHHALEELQHGILKMGVLVEEAIYHAVKSLAKQDLQIAEQVIANDKRINDKMIEIESACLKLLALQQPMASDLRVIGTAMKIVTDLERIGDHAVDIAKTTRRLEGQKLIKELVDTPRMADMIKTMLHDALNSYVKRDVELAMTLATKDDEVDALYKQIFSELQELMEQNGSTVKQATMLLMVCQSLERIGDHATNIGEWVIYMVSGDRTDLNI
ncbi:phosphate signaling complex protein PhoU [Tumebacillus permanentifrigoris]|uniref:Phosphate-specific transport system accessory protein PhoU n=1 Tax=Tumebacillus permanentifrigoris TaxID=378543 RepID=A0A316E075_9BACL|nr:phosphate signaling complex protein PhoU [Tumebacillus permanentifrigoris]PWK16200.1 phosphate transport system protein [Tumebacillus permanentifrigoris]